MAVRVPKQQVGLFKMTLTLSVGNDDGASPIESRSSNQWHECRMNLRVAREGTRNGGEGEIARRRMALTTTVHVIIHDGDHLK